MLDLFLGGRVIPAGAGNAVHMSAENMPGSGHPRGCGERTEALREFGGDAGSSPRVRGTLEVP